MRNIALLNPGKNQLMGILKNKEASLINKLLKRNSEEDFTKLLNSKYSSDGKILKKDIKSQEDSIESIIEHKKETDLPKITKKKIEDNLVVDYPISNKIQNQELNQVIIKKYFDQNNDVKDKILNKSNSFKNYNNNVKDLETIKSDKKDNPILKDILKKEIKNVENNNISKNSQTSAKVKVSDLSYENKLDRSINHTIDHMEKKNRKGFFPKVKKLGIEKEKFEKNRPLINRTSMFKTNKILKNMAPQIAEYKSVAEKTIERPSLDTKIGELNNAVNLNVSKNEDIGLENKNKILKKIDIVDPNFVDFRNTQKFDNEVQLLIPTKTIETGNTQLIYEDIASNVHSFNETDQKSLLIEIDNPNIGKMQFSVEKNDLDQIKISVNSSNNEVMQILKEGQSELRSNLSKNGIILSDLKFEESKGSSDFTSDSNSNYKQEQNYHSNGHEGKSKRKLLWEKYRDQMEG